jgi:hypothetical protein
LSNFDTSISSPVPAGEVYNVAVILDESWIYLDDRSSVTTYAAFVRKFNHYLLLPSVWPPHNRFTFLSCQRVFNAYSVGIPVWVYRWQLGMRAVKEKGYFGILNPSSVFGMYDTEYVPVDDGGIGNAIKSTGEARGFKGKNFEVVTLDDNSQEIDRAIDAVEDVGFDVQEAVNSIESIKRRLSH